MTSNPTGNDDAAQQSLPSYEEVIQMSGNFTDAPPNVPDEREQTNIINMQQLEQRTITDV